MKLRSRRARVHRGFTLVELLTVIAIIAILAGLLFPVFATARENARKGHCTTNMQQIIQAIKMYKDDWRVYPDALFGLQTPDAGGTLQTATRLFPEYVKSDKAVFQCPNSPTKVGRDEGWVQPINPMTGAPYTTAAGAPINLIAFSSYDFQFRPMSTGGTPELRYNRSWTTASLGSDPRQLIFRDPPDTTVVTWCLYHTSMDQAGMPGKNTQAIVGFLNGRVQTIPADKLSSWPDATGQYPWQVQPKP